MRTPTEIKNAVNTLIITCLGNVSDDDEEDQLAESVTKVMIEVLNWTLGDETTMFSNLLKDLYTDEDRSRN